MNRIGNRNQNPMCDGDHCTVEAGEVRVLPVGPDSNANLCIKCYMHEMETRRDRNLRLGNDFPPWKSLALLNDSADEAFNLDVWEEARDLAIKIVRHAESGGQVAEGSAIHLARMIQRLDTEAGDDISRALGKEDDDGS